MVDRMANGSVKHILDGPRQHQDQAWRDWRALVQAMRLNLASKVSDLELRKLLNDSMALYRTSFVVPPTVDKLLLSISGRNSSLLEVVFMWLGGWRPSSAVTLVYSQMGVNLGDYAEAANPKTTTCLLSKVQLSAMEELHKKTLAAEREINDGLASVQMLLADQNMAEAFGLGGSSDAKQPLDRKQAGTKASGLGAGRVNRLIEKKLAALRTLYMQANALRLQTLQDLLNFLSPVQAAQCAVAAFEMAYALKNLGSMRVCKTRPD